MSELLMLILIAIASLFIIMRAASHMIYAIAEYAKKTGISNYLIGFLVVAIGTSLPELSTSVFASLADKGQLMLGDVIGASIIDMTIVLGSVALIGRKIKIHGKIVLKTMFTVLAMVVLPLLLGLDGSFSRTDGVILIGAFFAYICMLLKKEGQFGKIKKQVKWADIWLDMTIFLGALVALILGARWFVFSSLHISRIMNISIYTMGLFFIAFGTTTPELVVNIKSVLKGLSNIAFGNLLGSVVANMTLIVGIASVIKPIFFDRNYFILSASFMIGAILFGLILLGKKEINWKNGLTLISVYFLFLLVNVLFAVR